MTLDLSPNIATGLARLAAARGVSVEDYLREIVEQRLAVEAASTTAQEEGSGMILENGLLIYGAGTALPSSVIDDAIRRSREDRAQHLMGHLS